MSRSIWGHQMWAWVVAFATVAFVLYLVATNLINRKAAADAAIPTPTVAEAPISTIKGLIIGSVPAGMRTSLGSVACQATLVSTSTYDTQCGRWRFVVSLTPPAVRPGDATTARSWDAFK